MRRSLAALAGVTVSTLLAAAPGPARADSIEGTILDPALRQKVDLIYVERVDGAAQRMLPAVVVQRNRHFVPRLTVVTAGTRIVFQSEDAEPHGVVGRTGGRVVVNQTLTSSSEFERAFDEVGVVRLGCPHHKEMTAFVVVLQNPNFTYPDPRGNFRIPNLERGTYTVRVWGEGLTDAQRDLRLTFTTVDEVGDRRVAVAPSTRR